MYLIYVAIWLRLLVFIHRFKMFDVLELPKFVSRAKRKSMQFREKCGANKKNSSNMYQEVVCLNGAVQPICIHKSDIRAMACHAIRSLIDSNYCYCWKIFRLSSLSVWWSVVATSVDFAISSIVNSVRINECVFWDFSQTQRESRKSSKHKCKMCQRSNSNGLGPKREGHEKKNSSLYNRILVSSYLIERNSAEDPNSYSSHMLWAWLSWAGSRNDVIFCVSSIFHCAILFSFYFDCKM